MNTMTVPASLASNSRPIPTCDARPLPSQNTGGNPSVYHVQRRALVPGRLLFRQSCIVLEERLRLEGCFEGSLDTVCGTIYTPVYRLLTIPLARQETVEQALSRYQCWQAQALYTLQQGALLHVYTPYLAKTSWFGAQAALPVYSCDREAMFQVAFERARLAGASNDATLKLPRLKRCPVSSRAGCD